MLNIFEKIWLINSFKFQDVGFKGDLGYETFLHGSQAEIRKVFVILIQKLPKVNEQPITDSSAGNVRKISNEMKLNLLSCELNR